MKRMETNAITKEIERRLVRIMEKVGFNLTAKATDKNPVGAVFKIK